MIDPGRRPPTQALLLVALVALASLLSTVPAAAHTQWANGVPVPDWVRDACCGPADIHHLQPEEVHVTRDGYRVAGVRDLVPFAKTLVSEDSDYWIFYRNFPDGTQYVFCFFAPATGY